MRYPGDFFPAGNPRGIPAEANVVIVGGGLAGLELAKELQRRGTRDVVVLEAGSRGDGTHVNASAEAVEALEMWLNADEPSELWRPWTSATPPYYTRHGGLRRRLGGRSLYWHGVVLPIEPWALSAPAWPQRIVDDLTTSWLGGPGLYDVVRSELAAWTGGRGDEPPQLKVGDVVLSPTPKAIRRAGRPGGWEAYSPISYWSESGEAGGDEITLLPDCTVLGVAVRDGRTAGVVFREAESDAHITINSTRVVLAAGTIENARLAAQARRDAGSAAPPILSGLVDHIEQGILVVARTADLPLDMVELVRAASAHHAACDELSRTHLFTRLYLVPDSAGELAALEVYATGEQERGPHGYVECDADGGRPWPTTVHSTLSERDRETVAAGRRILAGVWHDLAAMTGLPAGEPTFPDFADPGLTVSEALRGMARGEFPAGSPVAWCSLLGTVDHEAGTLPLGELLDDDHQFADVPGLYAAGPAVFPRCGAANPSLTTLALSRRLADRLVH